MRTSRLNSACPLFALALCFVSVSTSACPQGMITNPIGAGGQSECIPGSNYQNWGGGNSGGSSATVYNGYGAFALDEQSLKLGVSDPKDLFRNERQAKRSALKSCKANGGVDCKIVLTFVNECAVTMFGATDSSGSKLAIYTGKGVDIEHAGNEALAKCKATGSPMCEPGQSDCVERWRND
ncbi:DUF4189 domain-containing protein [Lysobacter enzymogenes]|uniref:DUF4189 domain-containing protein n=1 Tax=Lysobacter enzymogenes TaxID=69 RepID=UPI0019D16CD0|nr:DUF4189 domain-containing protein [Lysobacter enzymogenes]